MIAYDIFKMPMKAELRALRALKQIEYFNNELHSLARVTTRLLRYSDLDRQYEDHLPTANDYMSKK